MNIQLNKNGLEELDNFELSNINGGVFTEILLGLLGAALYDCIANHEEFTKGFLQGYKDATT